ncbi:hypothetical protein BKA58DRAFT_14633 [Alternaria rosae]|uniref:uncharacterized protein n=1 Tax=Alternaria rosae TaxID=1187941 RepID=UPI001E8CEE98|nr:uncharacterized protein BKA58DRAFT_14633 [Alternaria rosae]KAH6882161.1 hypothetical protein BKA58DRAFT_14633 [Alternaria rosae]
MSYFDSSFTRDLHASNSRSRRERRLLKLRSHSHSDHMILWTMRSFGNGSIELYGIAVIIRMVKFLRFTALALGFSSVEILSITLPVCGRIRVLHGHSCVYRAGTNIKQVVAYHDLHGIASLAQPADRTAPNATVHTWFIPLDVTSRMFSKVQAPLGLPTARIGHFYRPIRSPRMPLLGRDTVSKHTEVPKLGENVFSAPSA